MVSALVDDKLLELESGIRCNQNHEVNEVFEGKIIRGLRVELVKNTLNNMIFRGISLCEV